MAFSDSRHQLMSQTFPTLVLKVSYFPIVSNNRGDLLRSVPFIMWGHLNIEFFQTSAALIFTRNPKSTCLMMIFGHSGQAPKPFLHLLTHYEMSPHDNNKIRIVILIYFFL